MDGCERCAHHTSSCNEGGIGPISIGVIGSPETSHADHGFMTETMMSVEDWQKTEFFSEFLEVLQATDEPEVVWLGVSGQISKLGVKVDEKVDNVDEKIDSVDGKVNNLDEKIDSVDDKVEKLATQMNENVKSMDGKVDKLAAEMSELKELMKALVDSNNV